MLAVLVAVVLASPHNALAQVSRFPFRFDGRVLIPLQVDGSKPLDVVLDTGLGTGALILMHLEAGTELGLKYARTVNGARGAGTGENRALHVTAGDDLAVPGVDLGKLPVAVMDQHRAESSQHNVGVVGLALLGQYVVEMDFDESQITLYDPASFVPPDGWEEVPLVFEKTLPVLETSLSVDGKTEIPVRLIVDTGGKAALALAIDSAKGLAPPARAVDFLAGTGFRGDVYAPHGRVAKIQVGSEELDDVVGGFWRGAQAPFLAGANADALLSLGALDHFNLIFDFPHRRMFLKPNGFFSEPFELNMAGMQLEETPSGETVVYYVAENSEAARQGLRKGDRVLSVDGRDVGAYDYRELKQVFENAGSTVSLRIERDGTAKTVSLSLRRIL